MSGRRPVRVREAVPEDEGALTAMVAALQEHERRLVPWMRPGHEMAAQHLAHLRRRAEEREGRIFVATAEDPALGTTLLGFVACHVEEEGPTEVEPGARRYGWIAELYVVPEARRRGIARVLVERACAHFARRGIARVDVAYLDANREAHETYLQLGFTPHYRIVSRRLERR